MPDINSLNSNEVSSSFLKPLLNKSFTKVLQETQKMETNKALKMKLKQATELFHEIVDTLEGEHDSQSDQGDDDKRARSSDGLHYPSRTLNSVKKYVKNGVTSNVYLNENKDSFIKGSQKLNRMVQSSVSLKKRPKIFSSKKRNLSNNSVANYMVQLETPNLNQG